MDNANCSLRLKWNNFPSAVSSSLESLRSGGDLVDTQLWCEGRCFKAHRVVLSACSHYFRQIFLEVSSPNVQVILSNIPHQDVDLVLQFIYSGEVSLSEPQLASFLKTAEILKVKGLGPECTREAPASAVPQETQFLAAALQKPLTKRTTPPPLLSVHNPFTPGTSTGSSSSSLPSIDLGLAISNFTNNNNNSSSDPPLIRKRKLLSSEQLQIKTEETSNKELLTPPNSIQTSEDAEEIRTAPQAQAQQRPYQSQCRGDRPRNARIPFCPHCDEDCHNISVLRYHVKTIHSEPSGCLCCCFCTAVFNLHSAAEYKQHTLDTHGVKYI